MAFELKPGQGSLFKNDRKKTDNHPDYTGSVNINGVEHWLSAWIKSGAKGKFMSLAVGEPKQKQGGQSSGQDSGRADYDDGDPLDGDRIPF